MKKKIMIEGMTCNHCTAHVTEALEGLDASAKVKVELETKQALFESEQSLDDETLKKAVVDAGYQVTGIE